MKDAYRGRRGRRVPHRDRQRSLGGVGVEFLIVTDRGSQRAARARARALEDLSEDLEDLSEDLTLRRLLRSSCDVRRTAAPSASSLLASSHPCIR